LEKVVITGGTGLIGQALIPVFQSAGYEAVAVRRPYKPEALEGASAIINLAGENLSSGWWTAGKKRRITASRVETLAALLELTRMTPGAVKTVISASAIGYYGSNTSEYIYTEEDPAGSDFLSQVCRDWEQAAGSFEQLGVRVAKIRIGVVLSENGGALPKLMMPLKFGISVPIASGKQWMPWIHIDDLARIFLHVLQHENLTGPFNAVSPEPVTNRDFMKQLARKNHRLFIPVGIPGIFLKIGLGEMAVVTLEGSRVSAEKIIQSGFEFQYPSLESALA
jgi:uncharacterized protein